MSFASRLLTWSMRLWNNKYIRIISGGLIMLLPILMAGAFALILKSFPVPAYQQFITSFYGGFLYSLFDTVYFGTFRVLSVYMTITIAISYQRETGGSSSLRFGQIITALACFFILSGIFEDGFTTEFIGVKGMITALLSGYFSSFFFGRL